MNYIFHIRSFVYESFIELESSLLIQDPQATFLYLTMERSCFNRLKKNKHTAIYLPDEFSKIKTVDMAELLIIDNSIYKKYGYRLNYLFETERFKPDKNDIELFIYAHAKWYMDNLKSNSILISMNCEHFCYSLSGIINSIKGGKSIFIQPVGFPVNGNVILRNPWQSIEVNNVSLSTSYIDEFMASLSHHPEKTINYMRPKPKKSIYYSIKNRFRLFKNLLNKQNIFTYLEERPNFNIIPDRFKKFSLPRFINLVDIEFIKAKKKEGVKIFYIPLQYEPEMSILSYSPFFKNQLELIRLTSQSLSVNDIIVVKENPAMLGKRDNAFYHAICRYHNVYIANPNTNSRDLIRNSFKVLALTGTACIESIFLGINSLMFGFAPLRKLLIDDVLSNQPISCFPELLYKFHTQEEILNNAKKNWSKLSQSIIIGNFIPVANEKYEYIVEDKKILVETLTSIVSKLKT